MFILEEVKNAFRRLIEREMVLVAVRGGNSGRKKEEII